MFNSGDWVECCNTSGQSILELHQLYRVREIADGTYLVLTQFPQRGWTNIRFRLIYRPKNLINLLVRRCNPHMFDADDDPQFYPDITWEGELWDE